MVAICLQSVKIDRAPSQVSRGHRLVFVLARPLEGTIYSAVASDTDKNALTIKQLLDRLQRPGAVSAHDYTRLGMIHQMFRNRDGTTSRRIEGPFAIHDLIREFPRFSIAYAGETRCSDQQISRFAAGIMELRSDYRVLENNCQHFSKSLIRDITGKDLGPRTIHELMRPYVEFVENAKSVVRLRANSFQPSPGHEKISFLGVSEIPASVTSVIEEVANVSGIEESTTELDMAVNMHWVGLQAVLHPSERRYLTGLNLGNPHLVQNFWVTDDGGTRSNSMCVLFPKILLLFREQKESSALRFERPNSLGTSPPNSPTTTARGPSKWSVYGVMFPRHMLIIETTLNGFELQGCPGMWLGLNRVSATLRLKFEIMDHGVEVPNRWVSRLQIFKETEYDREYTSIFDRLPLDLGFASEIDIVLDEDVLRSVVEGSNPTDPQIRVLRTVTKGSLDYLTYESLRDLVSRRLQSWGRLTAEQLGHYRIKCVRKDNTLCEISGEFPDNTDMGWREFFAGVFYVDFH